MDDSSWPLTLQDAVYKYSLRLHVSIGSTQLHEWLGFDATPKCIFAFCQLSVVNRHSATKIKLAARVKWTRYVHPLDRNGVMTMDQDGNIARLADLHFYDSE